MTVPITGGLKGLVAKTVARVSSGMKRPRVSSLDAARGWAMVLMIFRHAWHWTIAKHLIDEHTFSGDWWICLMCRPSVPLFFMCFGFMLSYLYLNKTPAEIRRKLWGRAWQVFILYKFLFLCEMIVFGFPWPQIWEGLTYQRLSYAVEVLNFYFFMLLLAPWVIYYWHRLDRTVQWSIMVGIAWFSVLARATPWSHPVLQALLVGRAPMWTFELFPHAITFLVGVSLGRDWRTWNAEGGKRKAVTSCLLWSIPFILIFLYIFQPYWKDFDDLIVFYGWKHPVAICYMCFTTAFALLFIAALNTVMGSGLRMPSRFNPLELLGRHALFVFFLHWMVIFVVFGRAWSHDVTSDQARWIATGLVVLCWVAAWAQEMVVARLDRSLGTAAVPAAAPVAAA